MKTMSVRKKMIWGLGVLLLLIIALNVFSLVNLRNIGNKSSGFYEGPYLQGTSCVALSRDLAQMKSNGYTLIFSGKAGTHSKNYQDARTSLDADLETISGNPDFQDEVSVIQSSLENVDKAYQSLSSRPDNPLALANFTKAINDTEEAAAQLVDTANQAAVSYMGGVSEAAKITAIVQISLFAAIVLLALFMTIRLSAGLAKPALKVAEGVAEIAKGHLDTQIEPLGNDEIGALACELNGTISHIKSYIDQISDVLDQVGTGNINVEINGEYIGDFEKIKTSLVTIVERLNHTMRQISNCCREVRTASESLSQSSQHLAQGASEQSSAMEIFETSLEQVSTLTAQDGVNAAAVKTISMDASACAQKSDDEMKRMTVSMKEIESSSREIEKVIKLIEDIAFQTNILALNAAVEAARAGSAGKGFAVVADEVRNLANRSQDAVKNTRSMISNAIRAVNDGLVVADSSANALQEVRSRVETMVQRLEDIDKSTSEQAIAFKRMQVALRQISSVVHSNSESAEENSAASQALFEQAALLERLVETFKLKEVCAV